MWQKSKITMATGREHKREKGASKYKYVNKLICEKGVIRWGSNLPGFQCTFNTERECALAVDKKLIERGKCPINILIRA
jgi:hypothetical protein